MVVRLGEREHRHLPAKRLSTSASRLSVYEGAQHAMTHPPLASITLFAAISANEPLGARRAIFSSLMAMS